jgi:murein DD-endopeptidase MepM/ murein hydrolase activator NlpD
MEIPPYLQDKRLSSKKRFPARALFNIIFILSLGLNAYFINAQQGSGVGLLSENEETVTPDAGGMADIQDTDPAQVEPVPVEPVQMTPGQITSAEVKVDPVRLNRVPAHQSRDGGQTVSITPASYVVKETPVEPNVHVLQLKIRNSLTYSVCKAMSKEQGCETMSAYMSRLLSWFMDINKHMRKGDALDVIYETVADKNLFRILKLTYNSQYSKKLFEANYFSKGNNGLGSYFDSAGVEIAKSIVDRYAPLRSYQEITSLPGDFRKGPVGHVGTDFKTEVGTDVFASFEAKVTRTNWNVRANGYCVELDHPREGVKTLYLHLSRVLVKPGQFVKQGDKIAETGNTGRTYAPHLHYEIKSRGKKKIVYNPFNFKHIKSYYKEVPSGEWESFQQTVSRYNSILQRG